MSQFPWNRTVLYFGQFLQADDLPWHYLPVWIGITTPLIVVLPFLAGLISWARTFYLNLKNRRTLSGKQIIPEDDKLLDWTVIILWIAIPIAAVLILHSALYDGWRQMFFIYPAIVWISVLGLKWISNWISHFIRSKNLANSIFGILLFVGLLEPIIFIARFHPFENVYFNALAGEPSILRSQFELDYWGLSYKQAVDYILENDPRQSIKISFANPPGYDYVNSGLSADQKSRLVQVNDPIKSDYFATEFRWHPEDYPYNDEFYSIEVGGTKIMAVYRMK